MVSDYQREIIHYPHRPQTDACRVDAIVIFCTPVLTCLLATFETNQYLLKSNLMFSSFVKEIDVFILILCMRCNPLKRVSGMVAI